MCKNSLSHKCVGIWRIRATIILIALWFICGGIAVFSFTIAVIFTSISILLYFFVIFFYIQASYDSYTYIVGSEHIVIEKGVFLTKKINIFKNRVQYTQLIQTPLQRFFRTCTVAYQVAGAVVYLSEIDLKKADGAMFNEKK